jgi:transposase-like protein
MIPLKTAVLTSHQRLVTGVVFTDAEGIVVEMDVRRAPWRRLLDLPRRTEIHWADVRTVDIKELSVGQSAIRYRLAYGDGWYVGAGGQRKYFALQPHLEEIDLDRRCTMVAVRASVLMAVMAGIGLRCVCWLMSLLFHFEVSKSSLDRWVKECAARLPDAAGMAKQLHADKQITEAHFDEIFAKGQRPKRCTLVLRDEHGRIFAAREVEERDEETVTTFLRELKSWGIEPRIFYVDGCEAYRNAIRTVFPSAIVQYDYFHVIQCVWKKLWKAVVARRKDIKARGESVETPAYSKKLALRVFVWVILV